MFIDISDINTQELLRELWNNTITAAFYKASGVNPPPYKEPSNYSQFFDYHCGRPIKTNFTDLTKVNTDLYNRDAGDNKFEDIVAKLRS